MQNSTMCNSTICEDGLVTKYPMLNLKQLTKDSILLIYISGLHIYIQSIQGLVCFYSESCAVYVTGN